MLLGEFDDWAGWDHFLDQHIGMTRSGNETGNDNSGVCLEKNSLTEYLTQKDRPVGQRVDADEFYSYYVSYAGGLSWSWPGYGIRP